MRLPRIASIVPAVRADPEASTWAPYFPLINARLVTIEVICINGETASAMVLERVRRTFAKYVLGEVRLVEGESATVAADSNGRVNDPDLHPILARRQHGWPCDIALVITPGIQEYTHSVCFPQPNGSHVVMLNKNATGTRAPNAFSWYRPLRFAVRRDRWMEYIIAHELLHTLKVPYQREHSSTKGFHHCTHPDCILFTTTGHPHRFAWASILNFGPATDLCRRCQEEIGIAKMEMASRAPFELGDSYPPLAYHDELVRLNPDRPIEFMYRAEERLKCEDFIGAAADYSEALRLGAGAREKQCLNNRAVTLGRAGRNNEALADWRRLLELDPAHDAAKTAICRLEALFQTNPSI